MNLLDLPEEKFKEVKKQLLESGMVFEKKKINSYDSKFFETVTISNTLIKFFLFFSLSLYVLINVVALVLAIINNPNFSGDIIGTIVGLFVICIIVSAMFSNINTNKKKEEFPIYVKGDNFIFNFSDGVVATPNLFYTLPYENIKKVEFLIHKLSKKQLFGSVTFTFNVLDYEVTHTIRFTNLTKIEQLIKSKFPSLLNKLIVDGKSNRYSEPIKNKQKPKYILISFAVFIVSILLIVIPYLLNYHSVGLIISGVLLFITSIIVFLSYYIYTFYLIQGTLISSAFILMGFCMPLIVVERSGISFYNYFINNPQVFMPTIMGIIGLCAYTYIVIIIIGKIHYLLESKNLENSKS